jgi:hypothetical protein
MAWGDSQMEGGDATELALVHWGHGKMFAQSSGQQRTPGFQNEPLGSSNDCVIKETKNECEKGDGSEKQKALL